MRRPPLAFLAIAAVLVAGLVLLGTEPPVAVAERAPEARRQEVLGSLAVCPELLRRGSDVSSSLTVGTASDGDVVVRAASVLPGSGSGPVVLSRGGEVSAFGVPGQAALAVAATAVGPKSGSLEAEQVSRGIDGIQRGLAGTRCASTVQDTWFVATSTLVGHEAELILVNPYDDSALVDLELLTIKGPVDDGALQGLVVPPRSRVVRRLADLAPDEKALAVRVLTRQGRVAPALRDARSRPPDTPYGVDWVPRAGRPTGVVDLPGVPDGNGQRLLFVAVPGEDDAVVDVELTTFDGQFVPDGMREVSIRAGSVQIVDLTKVLGGKPANVRVTGEGAPILAGIYAENRARFGPIREFAYIGATAPLSGPALITDSRFGEDTDTYITLSAPEGEATVRIGLMPLAGVREQLPAPVDAIVRPGKLLRLSLRLGQFKIPRTSSRRPFVVTPLPGSAPVYGARVIYERGTRGPLFTVLGLASQPVEGVLVPETQLDPLLPVPRRG